MPFPPDSGITSTPLSERWTPGNLPTKDRRGLPVVATGDMRERIAAAIRASEPSFWYWFRPAQSHHRFLYDPVEIRQRYLEWADNLLQCCDHLRLVVRDGEAE